MQSIPRIADRVARGSDDSHINKIAIKLSSKYPQSGMTLDAIVAEFRSVIASKRSLANTADEA